MEPIEEFTVYSSEEKSLAELLVYYTKRRNWNKVIAIAVELIELDSKDAKHVQIDS